MKKRRQNKKYFLILYLAILLFPGLMIGQSDKITSKEEIKTRWDPYPQTKLQIAPHAAGQLVAPADSKARMMLSHANGHDLDCNLRPSKDGELVLAHDVVSDHNFWGDLDRTRIPYDSARAKKIGDYDYSQYKEEFHIRFEDYLDYMKKEAPELILYVEVKDHNQIQQEKAVQKIIAYGLTDRVWSVCL